MSNLLVELGEQPPSGSILLLQVGSLPIDPPEGSPEGSETDLWNLTGWYSTVPEEQTNPQGLTHAVNTRFPQGFKVAFSVSSDELLSALHLVWSLSGYFRNPTVRVMLPDDPLSTRLPRGSLSQQLVPPTPETAHQGTGWKQPSTHPAYTLPWFVSSIAEAVGIEMPSSAPPDPVPAAAVELHPGAMQPLEVVVAPEETPNNGAPKKTTKRKRTKPTTASA